MGLTRVAIVRPLFMAMVILAILVMGAISYSRLAVELWPSIDFPVVTVVTPYPGASPETVEDLVSRPIEDALSGLSNLDYMMSISAEGVSYVWVVFTDRADPDAAAIDVERTVSQIRSTLPSDVQPPSVIKADLQALPVINLSVSGGQSLEEVRRLVDERIAPRLQTVDGVAQVDVLGGQQREVQVRVDPAKLEAYHLSLLQVVQALQQDNVEVPAGSVAADGRERNVRFNARIDDPSRLGDVVVSQGPAGPVRLRDVATVEDTVKRVTLLQRTDGREGVGISVTKQATANALEVTDGVKEVLRDLQPTLPSGVTVDVVSDTSVFARRSLDEIQQTLIEAVLLTGAVLLVFLHTWRSTAIVLLAIPTSLIATFGVMYLLGFSLNTMSMMALALVIGILVDDSIVVLENIYRHLQLGETPFTAALNGRSEIGLAAIAITLVDVVVFTPVAFMSGITGGYFRQFGLVVAVATLFSLFVSFTLTPMLAARVLRVGDERGRGLLARFGRRWDAGFERLNGFYRRVLAWGIRRRWTVVALGVLSFVGGLSLLFLGLVSTEFLPRADEGEFTIVAEMPPATTLEATDRAVRIVEERLRAWPEVEHLFTTVGRGSADQPESGRYASITVKLKDRRYRQKTTEELAEQARGVGDGIPGLTLRTQLPGVAGPGGQPVQVRVLGDDQTVLRELARQVEEVVRATPGTRDVVNSAFQGQPELVLDVNRQRAADLGVSPAQVASTLRTAVAGTVVTTYRPPSGSDVDVRVLLDKGDTLRPHDLANLPVVTQRGTVVRLGQVATVREQTGPTQITRYNRQRQVTIGADLAGRPLGDVANDIQQRLQHLAVPSGYRIEFGGETEAQEESFQSLGQALALSILFMYMLMVALYESLLYPFIIMLSLPLAIIGALGGLAATGHTLNMVSMIGMIMLTGLVGKNAILLVDYTNTLRKRGMERNAALLEAGPTRLRPILMTTAAMVFAMLPVALKTGEGAEFRAPMAVVVIGGLLTSTLLTLLFIPAVYTIFDDLQRLVLRLLRRRPKGELGDAAGGVSGDLPPRRRTAGEMEPRVGGVHTAVHGPQVASEG